MNGTKPTAMAAVVTVCLLAAAREGHAIPEWARKYKTSCATCHEAFPRLTGIGEAFRLNGYRFPQNDEAYVRIEPVVLGAEPWKRVFPEAIWPSTIPGTPPISVRLISDYDVDIGGSTEARSNFKFPQEMALLMGGTLGDSLSFFLEAGFEPAEDEFGVEGFLNIEDIFSGALGENRLNLRIGSVGMYELDLPNSRDHQRLTRFPYLKNEFAIHYPVGFTERNDFNLHTQAGVMLYGFSARYQYALGVVNGNGAIEDNNSEKDVFFQFAYKIGGLGYDGSGGPEAGDEIPVTPSGQWVDDSVRLGTFVYLGRADVVDPLGFGEEDRFWRLGFDAKWKWLDLGLTGGVVFGSNDEPYGTLSDDSVDSRVWFGEAEYFVYPWLVGTVRYEALAVDEPTGILATGQDRARVVPSILALLRANVRVIAEARLYTKNEPREDVPGGDRDDDDAFVIRVDFAF
ncbi:MAG: hypothetical protein HY716_06745 [Planctomycetes bacterium]|nr:hypothetical protein [Planctomycetota bacterium]